MNYLELLGLNWWRIIRVRSKVSFYLCYTRTEQNAFFCLIFFSFFCRFLCIYFILFSDSRFQKNALWYINVFYVVLLGFFYILKFRKTRKTWKCPLAFDSRDYIFTQINGKGFICCQQFTGTPETFSRRRSHRFSSGTPVF